MKRTIGAILFVIYSIIAIAVTVLLLSFNDYRCSEIGGYTVCILKDDALEPNYEEGSILLIEETSDKHVKTGDELFFYKVLNSTEYELVTRTLVQKAQQGRHVVYNVVDEEGKEESYDTNYFIGKAEEATVIGSPWGSILSILESKWGYLFCIVVVSLLLFLQEVFDLIIELKYGGTKGTKAANIAHQRKTANKGTSTKRAATAKTTTTKRTTTATTAAKKVATVADVNKSGAGVEEEG